MKRILSNYWRLALLVILSCLHSAGSAEHVGQLEVGVLYEYNHTPPNSKQLEHARNFDWGGVKPGMSVAAFRQLYPNARLEEDSDLAGVQDWTVRGGVRKSSDTNLTLRADILTAHFWSGNLMSFNVMVSSQVHDQDVIWSSEAANSQVGALFNYILFYIGSPETQKIETCPRSISIDGHQHRYYWQKPDAPLWFVLTYSKDHSLGKLQVGSTELTKRYAEAQKQKGL